jgi:hypothetical protein
MLFISSFIFMNLDDYGQQDAFLQRLDANLQRIRQVSAEFQRKLAAERTKGNPSVQTTYRLRAISSS